MINITSGSIETVHIDVEDAIGNLTDLAAAQARYDVKDKDGNFKIQNGVATNVGMRADCVVNTQGWAHEHFFLYLRFQALPDQPILGPFEFKVNP